MQVSEQRHRAGPSIHQTPYPADAGVQAVHHGVADRPRYRDNACAPQGAGAVDGEGRRGRSDAADPQGVRIGRVARSTQRTLARDPKRCNRTRTTAPASSGPFLRPSRTVPDSVNPGSSTVTGKSCVAVPPCGSRAVIWMSAWPTFSPVRMTVLSVTVTVAIWVALDVASYVMASPSGSLKYWAASKRMLACSGRL